MIHTREITISSATSRKSTVWKQEKLHYYEFVERLKNPVRSAETLEAYLAMPKSKQDELKDVGGYVGGALSGSRRKVNAVLSRGLVTLDFDNIPAGQTADMLARVDGLGCAAVVHSTRKHSEFKPRLRVIIPLNVDATADEYEPVARMLARRIGIEYADKTTFDVNRLMYNPSVCSDSDYICEVFDKPFCSKAGMLGLYVDWRNVSSWPQVPGEDKADRARVEKAEDPTTKRGVVGAFCRTYTITEAMAHFIPDAYTTTDTPGRYTYSGGSTAGGAVVYENDHFLFSHHATDPCSGQLVNAWDLVRLHKYAALDDDAQPGTPVHKLPSYRKLSEDAMLDADVTKVMMQDRVTQAKDAFGDAPQDVPAEDNWMAQMALTATGAFDKTINNVVLVLEHDSMVAGKIATDEFAGCGLAMGAMPWGGESCIRRWSDADDAGLRWYMEHTYGISSVTKIDDGITIVGNRRKINVVRDYLRSLKWDGVKRVETLFIDYLGAEDNAYTRAVARKTLAAACARAVKDGVKFDYMPILVGPQGIGKSTLLSTLGKQWFSDSLTTFEGKEAAEMIQGTWINEIGELTAMSHHETNNVKQFLSKTHDIYRAAYGKRTQEYPRRCVFIGTSNNVEILKDKTGNRRFWPIETMVQPKTKDVWKDLPKEVDQIWAEAYVMFVLGEELYLRGEEARLAGEAQAAHEEQDELAGEVKMFLDQDVTDNWDKLSKTQRMAFWGGGLADAGDLVERKVVCAREIYSECLGRHDGVPDPRIIRRINSIMRRMPGWKPLKGARIFGPYGSQRGFYRDTPQDGGDDG